jgi:hypothetical protein
MPKTLTVKQQFWFNHVIAAKNCALPLATYAAQHNLSAKSLYNWRWKFTQQNNSDMKKENPFIKIIPSIKPIPKIISVADHITQVTLPNGIILAMPNITTEMLSMLLRA